MMQISQSFTLAELTVTGTGLPNNPNPEQLKKLFYLANYLLQPIRNQWGPLQINSAFRSTEVNKKVGGVETGQHPQGEAADFDPIAAGIDEVFHWIVTKSGLVFGQAILEMVSGKEWIHLSLPRPGMKNGDALVYDGKVYLPYF